MLIEHALSPLMRLTSPFTDRAPLVRRMSWVLTRSFLALVLGCGVGGGVGCGAVAPPVVAPTLAPPSPAQRSAPLDDSVPELLAMSSLAGSRGSLGTSSKAPPPPVPDIWWRCDGIDHSALRETLVRAGLDEPTGFRLFVVEVTFDKDRERVIRERAFDWNAESDRNHGWNVASSIKIYAATAVLQRLRALGFSPQAKVLVDARSPEEWTLQELIELALIKSDNIAYNRLVQLAGYDWLNTEFFSQTNGFANSAIEKAYEQGRWQDMGESIELRHAPAFTIVEGTREHLVPAGSGESRARCGGSACTNLRDLTEAMRRVILHDVLPPRQQLGLTEEDQALLRDALGAPRSRGEGVAEQIRLAFPDADITVFHKPGFSNGWFSEVVFIEDVFRRQAWVLSLTAKRGRDGLNEAAFLLGEVLAYGELRKVDSHPTQEDLPWLDRECGASVGHALR